MEGLRGEITVAELCRKEAIEFAYPTQLVYVNKADSEVDDKTEVI